MIREKKGPYENEREREERVEKEIAVFFFRFFHSPSLAEEKLIQKQLLSLLSLLCFVPLKPGREEAYLYHFLGGQGGCFGCESRRERERKRAVSIAFFFLSASA